MFLQQWDELATDAVAQNVQPAIGRVFPKPKFFRAGVLDQLSFREPQERAHNRKPLVRGRGVGPTHSRQALDAGAAEQPEKKKFHLVIGVMGQCYCGDILLTRDRRKKEMTKVASSHFG